MTLPVADRWFTIDRYGDDLRLSEGYVDSYAVSHLWVVRGRELAVVIDAGSGIVAPAPFVESFVDTPVVCVATTCGYDHAGGWASFADRACHPADADDLRDPSAENAEIGDYLTIDRFGAVPWAGFDVDRVEMAGAEPTRLLADGEQLDLGGRRLEVLHVPGWSPGGVALWDADHRILFSGEILYDGDHGPAWPPPDPAAYARSIERLRRLPVERVHPGHYESFGRDRFLALTEAQLADLRSRSAVSGAS